MLGSSVDDEDRDRESIMEGVQAYFESVLEEGEDASGGEENAERAQVVLEAIEDEDYEPAFEYLSKEIAELEKERDRIERHDATAKAFMSRALDQQIEDLEKLREDLSILGE